MTNIQDIRKKYPQYSDMSDDQLANSLHQKYYSDMSIDKFYNSINLQKPNSGMALFEEMKANDKALSEIGLQSTLALGDFLSNSMSTAGRSLINPVIRSMGMDNIQPNPIKTGNGPIYEKAYEYAPIATAVGGGLVAGVPRAATMIGGGGLVGGLLNEEDPIGGILHGAGTAALGEGAGRLFAAGVEKYAPPVMKSVQDFLRGNLPTEEILNRIEAAKGTATGLGRILDQPQLTQFLENILKYSPFSGYQKGVNKTINNLEGRATAALEELSGGKIPQDVDILEEIQKQLQKSVAGTIKISDANYKELDTLAKELGIKVNRDNIAEASRKMLSKINANPELKRKVSGKMMQDLEFYSYKTPETPKYSEPAVISETPAAREKQNFDQLLTGEQGAIIPGQNVPAPRAHNYSQEQSSLQDLLEGKSSKPEYGFNESNVSRGLLGEDQYESLYAGKRHEAGQYGTLKKALDTDMRVAIEKSGDKELEGLWQEAQQFYKNQVVPTQSPRIKKFVNDPALTESESIIATFLRYGPKQDRVKLLKQLTNHLDEQGMERLRYAIFSDELGESSVQNMTKVWNKLGTKQKAELIPDEAMRESMEHLSQVAKLNPKALQEMYNPETGAKFLIQETLKRLTGLTVGYGAGLIPILGGRYATRKLTDEAAREAIVKALIDEGLSESIVKNTIKKLASPYAKAKTATTGLATIPKKESE